MFQLAAGTLFALVVAAGAPPAPGPPVDATWRATEAMPPPPTPPQQARRKDSLWNGALVGAGLGALAGFLTSEAIIECSECAGFNAPLAFGLLGAGAGAALGAG